MAFPQWGTRAGLPPEMGLPQPLYTSHEDHHLQRREALRQDCGWGPPWDLNAHRSRSPQTNPMYGPEGRNQLFGGG